MLPNFDVLADALFLGQKPFIELTGNNISLFLALVDNLMLCHRYDDIINTPGRTRMGRVLKSERFDSIKNRCDMFRAHERNHVINDGSNSLAAHIFIDKWVINRQDIIDQDTADGRLEHAPLEGLVFWFLRRHDFDFGAKVNIIKAMGKRGGIRRFKYFSRALCAIDNLGHPEASQDNIQELRDNRWIIVAGLQDVLVRSHNHLSFELRLFRQWNVNGHLVSIEVRIEGGTNEWVNLNGVAFNQDWAECLDTKSVQCRGAVQEHVFAFDDFFEDFPDFLGAVIDKTICATDVVGQFPLEESRNNEWAE